MVPRIACNASYGGGKSVAGILGTSKGKNRFLSDKIRLCFRGRASQTAVCPSGCVLKLRFAGRIRWMMLGIEPASDFMPENQKKTGPPGVLGRLGIENTA